MATTLLQCRTAVRASYKRFDNTINFPDTVVNQAINFAQDEIVNRAISQNPQSFIIEWPTPLNATAGTAYIAIPAKIAQVVKVLWGTNRTELYPAPSFAEMDLKTTGTPQYYFPAAWRIYLEPVPSVSGTYGVGGSTSLANTIALYGVHRGEAMATDAAEMVMPDDWLPVLVFKARIYLKQYIGGLQTADEIDAFERLLLPKLESLSDLSFGGAGDYTYVD